MRRRFGIELEHISKLSHEQIVELLVHDQHVKVDESATRRASSTRGSYSGWQVKSDGSIVGEQDFPERIELVSPPMTMASAGEIERVVSAVKRHGKVNMSCGFHVHVGASDLAGLRAESAFNRIARLWTPIEAVMFSYVTPSRWANDFCKQGVDQFDRYRAVNMTNLASQRQTIEFRLHQGTLNPRRILAFVSLCIRVVDMFETNTQVLHALDPTESREVTSKLVANKNVVMLRRTAEKEWVVKVSKEERKFNSLSLAHKELAPLLKLPEDPLLAFRYPSFGNAMSTLCEVVGLRGPMRGYLEARYDTMTGRNGFYVTEGTEGGSLQDEANFFNEPEL